MATCILAGAELTSLKKISISLTMPDEIYLNAAIEGLMKRVHRSIMSAMIDGLSKSVSTLTYLTLESLALDLEKMELLHSGAPNLKKMKLDYMLLEDAPNMKVSIDCTRLVDMLGKI